MKITMKHKILFSDADRLIERYYEGLTTVEEEKQLRDFLSQPNLPERFKPEQAIFGYFNRKKQKPQFRILPYVRWASVAAVVAFAVFSAHLFTAENKVNYAYIDGEKITNTQEIKSHALASLSDVSSKNNEVEDGINSLNDNQLVEQQLDVFSELK